MRNRIIAGAAAVLLAVVGTVVLLSYANGANSRALAGTAPVNVLVLSQAVPKNTPTKDIAALVTTKAIPEVAVLPGRVTNLDQLTGKVAAVDLVAGEQLVASRFVAPGTVQTPGGSVPVPSGMQEVTVQLDPIRAVGGQLNAGDTVGVFITLKPGQTHLTLQKVLVTKVQGGTTTAGVSPQAASTGSTAPAATPAPTGPQLITLATLAPAAERIVFAAENGSIWLSKEPLDANANGTAVITPDLVFK